MAIEYKRLTQKELDIFIQMRIHQLREEGAKEEIDLAPALKITMNVIWRMVLLYLGLLLTERASSQRVECHL